MQLDDGRFLVAPDKYDKLLKEHTQEELESWQLVRVSEDFHVVSLGLPVPKFRGHTLDPPLRSRFQSKNIQPLSFKDHFNLLSVMAPSVSTDKLSEVVSFVYSLLTEESETLGLPSFPVDNLFLAVSFWNLNPNLSSEQIIGLLYPYKIMLKTESQLAVENALEAFDILSKKSKAHIAMVESVKKNENQSIASVGIQWNKKFLEFAVPFGASFAKSVESICEYVSNPSHDRFLSNMLISHAIGDFCVIGPKGCGKTTLVHRFAELLGYQVDTVMLYQDMTSRDLLQQRRMLPSGDTIWQQSQLVNAARLGHLAVLDGLHRVHHSTLNVLQRLVHDRELELFDGTRLISDWRYELLKEKTGLNDQQLTERNIYRIHPSFRLIALAEPPNLHDSTQHWLTAELLNLFLFHNLQPLSFSEETTVISKLVENVSDSVEKKLLDFGQTLRQSTDSNILSVANHLSTRQILRIMKRLTAYPNECLNSAIHRACLSRFLPSITKSTLDSALKDADITPKEISQEGESVRCEVIDDHVYIGEASIPVFPAINRTMVPDILFYDNTEHLRVMEDMLKDWLLGEHLLLIGNQGVGKNKVADRFLQLLNRPRQYIQLHRDTTVQTLTLQSTVVDGVLVYEDSPLVKAVKLGHVLVIDEGDKAPTHVTCIIKSLLESGQMHLADGRQILPSSAEVDLIDEMNTIRLHRDFRVIVLANRPGFPFLGNDFYGALGDLFACHSVDNPSMESEMSMLRKYGPNVPEQTLKKLIGAFCELRNLADEGLLNYPYSSRELVNIIKHLERFPMDGLPTVARNVFDFDAFTKDTKETLVTVLGKHGIPLDKTPFTTEVKLAPKFPLPDILPMGTWGVEQDKKPLQLKVDMKPLSYKGPYDFQPSVFGLDRTDERLDHFVEQMASWQLPLNEVNIVADVKTLANGVIVAVTVNPISLYMINTMGNMCTCIDLYQLFPSWKGYFHPRVKLAEMPESFPNSVLLHEEMTNSILVVNLLNKKIQLVNVASPVKQVFDKYSHAIRALVDQDAESSDEFFRVLTNVLTSDGRIFLYSKNGQRIEMIDFVRDCSQSVSLGEKNIISECFAVAKDRVLIKLNDESYKLLSLPDSGETCYLKSVSGPELNVLMSSACNMPDAILQSALGQNIKSPNRLIASPDHYGLISIGFPELDSDSELYGFERSSDPLVNIRQPYWVSEKSLQFINPSSKTVCLENLGQIIRALPAWKAPTKITTKDMNLNNLSGFLEISDLAKRQVSYLPIPGPKFSTHQTSWLCSLMEAQFVFNRFGAEGVVTVDPSGGIRTWETAMSSIESSIVAWKRMMGVEEQELQINIERGEGDLEKLTEPKHGMMDPTGAPHIGGGTFAGGTGGYNTAGLGGAGGPYRLDLGHPVHQVPDSVKEQVPEHIREKAREMARRAYKKKLKEIKMSEFDAELYGKFAGKVEKQISLLKVIIDNLQAKGKERQWMRHQTSGDLDEGKLIEGLTGEKTVYRRRTDKEPEPGTRMEKPKRLRLCVDVSGSMYRFNGYDGRFQRTLESSLMAMEALQNYEDKIKYDIIGHSGEDPDVEFVHCDRPPKNEKERLDVLKAMIAHSQYCWSGDYTLEATKLAIKQLSNEEADERFVIVLSDANLDRYGIRPKSLAKIMNSDDRVNVFAIFIGSLGEQAAQLKKGLPGGKSFVCKETSEIPQILQQIFTSTVLASSSED